MYKSVIKDIRHTIIDVYADFLQKMGVWFYAQINYYNHVLMTISDSMWSPGEFGINNKQSDLIYYKNMFYLDDLPGC